MTGPRADSPAVSAGLVLVLVAAYVVLGLLGTPPVLVLAIAAAGGLALLAQQVLLVRVRPADLGLRLSDLRRAAPPAAAVTAVFAGGAVAFALGTGRALWAPDLAWMLPLYPLWGVVQQAIFQGILHKNLRRLLPPAAALALTTVAFALVHWGRIELVGLTAAAGFVWSFLYARCGNVLVLGISHGISAALAYPLVMGYDPLAGA